MAIGQTGASAERDRELYPILGFACLSEEGAGRAERF
jgi:hypothetical protein